MRLALSFPPPWRISVAPNNQVAAVLPGASLPEAVVTYGPIIVAPDEPKVWRELVAGGDRPPSTRIVVGRMLELTTVDGWPLKLLEAELRTQKDELVEVRMCAFYTFMEHAAAVIVRAQTADKLGAHGKSIVEVLRAGRPDWRGVEPACLSRVWDLGPRRARLVEDDETADLPQRLAASEKDVADKPDSVDAHYDLGQARFFAKDYAGALASFERVLELDPADVLVIRKVAQCLYALGRDEDANAQRVKLREAYARSSNPRLRLVSEYVFDQFEVDGNRVMAVETLQPRDPTFYTLLAFRADRLPSVLVDTSDQAKAAGTPYVVGVVIGGKFRAVATLAAMPPYPELKAKAIELMKSPPTQPA